MTNTTYFHLKKPAYADPIDVKDFTNNFDVIDTALMASRAEKTQLTNSINKDVVSPCYYIINDNEFDVTVTDRNFSGITYTIEAGHQKRFDLQHATGNMNYLVSDLHEVTFKWYELKGGSGGGSGTTDYSDLSNKPSINNVTLSGNKTLADIGILNSEGKIKSDLLPAFVDNYDSYANRAAFPATGVEDRLYLAQDTRLSYVWDTATSDYVVVGSPLALGEAEGTAYRGDRGKIAYEHSQATHARTDATAVSIPTNKNGYININGTDNLVYEHPKATGSSDTNPHGTTASDVGLENALIYEQQALSKEQKEQARANIGAGTSSFSGSYSDLSNIPSEFTPASHTHSDYISKGKQTLTDAEKAQARANIDAVGETTVSSVENTTSTVTVPACLGYAGVKMVGGKTQKVNQDSNGCTFSGNNVSITTADDKKITLIANNASDTAYASITGNASVSNHWYYLRTIGATLSEGILIYNDNNGVVLNSASSVKAKSTGNSTWFIRVSQGTTVNASFYLLILDITAMGLEDKTISELDNMFTSYVPYGSYLWNAPIEKIVSQSLNIVDTASRENSKFYTGHYLVQPSWGQYSLEADESYWNYRVEVKPNTTYSAKKSDGGTMGMLAIVRYEDANFNLISGDDSCYDLTTATYNTPANCKYISFSQPPVDPNALIMLCEGSSATDYIPYMDKTTISVPDAILSLPDYGCSAGSVYNWVDFENGVYHHNVGSIDMGSKDWEPYEQHGMDKTYYISLSDINDYAVDASNINIICGKYTTVNYSDFLSYGQIESHGKYVQVSDDNYSDKNAFKTAMDGVKLVYELATPEVKPISAFIPPIPCEQGGTITLQNPHSLDVPNKIVYKTIQ